MNNLYKKYMTSSSTGINAENLNDTNSTNKTKKRHKTRKASTIVSRNSQNNIIKTNTVSASDWEIKQWICLKMIFLMKIKILLLLN